jgi:hypothetical protein
LIATWQGIYIDSLSIQFAKIYIEITIARVYSQAKDHQEFQALIEAFHDAVILATGQSIQLQTMHGKGLTAYVFDAEAAQALGLARAIRRLPGVDGTRFIDDTDLLAHILVTCTVHFNRYIRSWISLASADILRRGVQNLGNAVTEDERQRLKSICRLKTEEEVQEWHRFCQAHKSDAVKSASFPWDMMGIVCLTESRRLVRNQNHAQVVLAVYMSGLYENPAWPLG